MKLVSSIKAEPPTRIDAMMFGQPEKMCPWLITGHGNAIVDPGPANTADGVIESIEKLGVDSIDAILLTHIHFDHAGGTGHLARRFPEATVYVHPRVAKHLSDPTALVQGVKSVWGPPTEELFGLPVPIDASRIQRLEDGQSVDLGDRRIEAISSPGHTRAHLSFIDPASGSLFAGDALGIQVPGSKVIRPSTPPADFSYDAAVASIERLRNINADRVLLPHFGELGPDPKTGFLAAQESLGRWRDAYLGARETAERDEDIIRRVHCSLEATLEPVTPSVRRSFDAINPPWLNVDGMNGEMDRLSRASAA